MIVKPRTLVRVRLDRFDQLCNSAGWTNDLARSRAIGISHTHLSRVRRGHVGIGGKFIGATLAALHVPFSAVFERAGAEQGQ